MFLPKQPFLELTPRYKIATWMSEFHETKVSLFSLITLHVSLKLFLVKILYVVDLKHKSYTREGAGGKPLPSYAFMVFYIRLNHKTYLLWKVDRLLPCQWVAMCSSCHCTTWLNDDHSPLSSCIGLLGLLHVHDLLTGYSLRTIKIENMRSRQR